MGAPLAIEIAAAAARLVVTEGMEYGPAKRRAARTLARHGVRWADLPSNAIVENEVRDYLALFCAATQARELAALRRLALQWMERLAEFRPHLSGAVWRGTATRLSAIHLDLYCDDSKSAEIALINLGVDYDVASRSDSQGGRASQRAVLSLAAPCPELGEAVALHLTILDHDDLRGALKPDAQGRSWRGDAAALRQRLQAEVG